MWELKSSSKSLMSMSNLFLLLCSCSNVCRTDPDPIYDCQQLGSCTHVCE